MTRQLHYFRRIPGTDNYINRKGLMVTFAGHHAQYGHYFTPWMSGNTALCSVRTHGHKNHTRSIRAILQQVGFDNSIELDAAWCERVRRFSKRHRKIVSNKITQARNESIINKNMTYAPNGRHCADCGKALTGGYYRRCAECWQAQRVLNSGNATADYYETSYGPIADPPA